MNSTDDRIRHTIRQQGVIDRRRDPALAGRIDWQVRTGRLVRLLPSIYTDPELADDHRILALAAAIWDPSSVITGATAARLTRLPGFDSCRVSFASARRANSPRFSIERRRIPPELIVSVAGVGCTSPALTALDLCRTHGGDGIDVALRTRRATLDHLWEAFRLTAGRRGNAERRFLLLDSRSLPWSMAERRAHRLLRAAGITGWSANFRVVLHGHVYYLDIAFPDSKVVLEIDGRIHAGADHFEDDRARQNDLVLAGWLVLRFTWAMITESPEAVLVAARSALELRRSAA